MNAAQQFQGKQLIVSMHWGQWLGLSLLVALVTAIVGSVAWFEWVKGRKLSLIFFLPLLSLCLYPAATLLWRAWQVLRNAALIRLDERGLQHAALPLLSWSEVRGLDSHVVQERSVQVEYLSVALTDAAWQRIQPASWKKVLPDMMRSEVIDSVQPVLLISGRWTTTPVVKLLAAAKHLADAAGAPRLKGWQYWQTLDEAQLAEKRSERLRGQQEEMQTLITELSQLQRASSVLTVQADELRASNEYEAGRALLSPKAK